MAFNDKAKKPFSCHGTQLAKATTSNKKILQDFTKTWTSEGNSNYSAGIEAAFSYFVSSEAEPQRNTRGNCSFFKFEKRNLALIHETGRFKQKDNIHNKYMSQLQYQF